MQDKQTLRIIMVSVGALVAVVLWLVTLRYNLQGGFTKKSNSRTVSAVVVGQKDEIQAAIGEFKDRLNRSSEQVKLLLQKLHG